MFRHCFIAALRNMAANRLQSAIAIFGLAVGIAAAVLMGLAVRSQTTYDHFIPNYERTYLVASPPNPFLADSSRNWRELTYSFIASFLKLNAPEVESIARMALTLNSPDKLQHGAVAGWEAIYWADPNIFDVLRLPVFQGDLAHALTRPDGIVLSRAMAEKYFGSDAVVGQILLVNENPMTVRAVIQDLPENATGLKSGIFASGLASTSRLLAADASRAAVIAMQLPPGDIYTYTRLRPSTDLAGLEKRFADHYWQFFGFGELSIKLLRLDQVNLFEPLNPGVHARIAMEGLMGMLLLFIVGVNFVNLALARSARREREVALRKICGASRRALALQFLGETLIVVVLATVLALATCEWLLPPLNAFLGTGAHLTYDLQTAAVVLLSVLLLTLAAGAYPALLLSSVRPANILRGWAHRAGAGMVRALLVTAQFAILVVLAIAAGVVWHQREFATHEALRMNIDQMLILRLQEPRPVDNGAFFTNRAPVLESELRKLPGVRGVVCSSLDIIGHSDSLAFNFYRNGALGPIVPSPRLEYASVERGLLELYGIKPLAGVLPQAALGFGTAPAFGMVINHAALVRLGFASPQAAVGHSWMTSKWFKGAKAKDNTVSPNDIVTAVVPDFALYSVTESVQPRFFQEEKECSANGLIHIKLDGQKIPETLTAIDRLWTATGMLRPEDRFFLDAYMQQQYLDMTRQAQMFAVSAAIAILLACLGLIGIAVSMAERRIKEIGVRKAAGATTAEIVVLLLFQFSKPVLWANVIAWPAAWWLMHQWLAGFAYHVDLHLWQFLAASGAALVIAVLTVVGQALLVARQKPVLALRYE